MRLAQERQQGFVEHDWFMMAFDGMMQGADPTTSSCLSFLGLGLWSSAFHVPSFFATAAATARAWQD